MTVRKFINCLLNFDMEEEIEFYIQDDRVPLNVVEFADDPSLPYVEFEFKEKENKDE